MEFPFTALATVVAVGIANRLSSRQSGHAKLWDYRRQAYGVILSELASVERLCNVDEAPAFQDDEPPEYIHPDSPNAQISEHMKTLGQRFSNDYLILSGQFIAAYEAFTQDLEVAASPYESYREANERFCETIRKHRPLLMAQGRKEMATQTRTWGVFPRNWALFRLWR